MSARLLPNSGLLNPGRDPKSNRTSRLFPGSIGKATKFVRTRGFSKLTRFRNTENLVNPLFWTKELAPKHTLVPLQGPLVLPKHLLRLFLASKVLLMF